MSQDAPKDENALVILLMMLPVLYEEAERLGDPALNYWLRQAVLEGARVTLGTPTPISEISSLIASCPVQSKIEEPLTALRKSAAPQTSTNVCGSTHRVSPSEKFKP